MAEDEGDVSDFSEDEDELIPLSVDPTVLQGKGKKRKETEGAGEGKDARPAKRARTSKRSAEGKGEGEGDEEEDDSENEGTLHEVLQVSFDFFDPKPSDHYTLRVLLKDYLDTEEWRPDALATLISEQALGTMVKAEGEDQPFGFATVVNLKRNKNNECIKAIRKYLLSKCDPAHKAQLTALLSEDSKQTVGLLIHERVINLPAELAPPLHDALLQDLAFVQTDPEAPEDARAEWQFDTFILLSRCFYPLEARLGAGGKKKKAKARASTADAAFYKFEDEFYRDESLFSFTFPVKQSDTQRERQTGVVMAIKANRLPAVVKKLQKLGLA